MGSTQVKPDFLDGFFARHGLFESTSAAETARNCSRALGPHRMWIEKSGDDFESDFSGIVTDEFTIARVRHGRFVRIEPQVNDDYIVHHALSGDGYVQLGKRRLATPRGVVTVISAGQPASIGIAANSVSLVVRLPRQTVEDCMRETLHRTVQQPIVFDARMASGGATACWAEAVQHVCGQYEYLGSAGAAGSKFARVFAEYLCSLLLHLQPSNYSPQLEQRGEVFAPRHVTAARRYLERNLAERVSMTTLTRVTGVSARTLQAGFRRWFDQTPMEYLRERRLEQVHRTLLAAQPGTRVSDVFLKFGIADFGRYARFYRERFGKTPSQDLRGAGTDPPAY